MFAEFSVEVRVVGVVFKEFLKFPDSGLGVVDLLVKFFGKFGGFVGVRVVLNVDLLAANGSAWR